MIRLIKTIAITLLFIVGITFAMENNSWVILRYYFGLESPPIPVFLLVAFSVLLGVLLAGFGFLLDQWSLKKALREKEREIAALQIELQPYREGQRVIEVKK
jgi:uncharacterized integral membrane protein